MPRIRLARIVFPIFTAVSIKSAHACTVCDSPTGHQLRAALFNGHFTHTLLLVLAPFPVFAALIVLLHLGMPDLALADEAPSHAFEPTPLPESGL